MYKEIYDRGIDNLKPGMLCVIGFPPLMDENFYNRERIEKEGLTQEELRKKISADVKNASKLPAIILEKKYTEDKWPVYKVAFWTRYRNGYEISGAIYIDGFCVWRYFAGDSKLPEGKPPNWMLESIENGNFDELLAEHGLTKKDICYVEHDEIDDDHSVDLLCYPFANANDIKNSFSSGIEYEDVFKIYAAMELIRNDARCPECKTSENFNVLLDNNETACALRCNKCDKNFIFAIDKNGNKINILNKINKKMNKIKKRINKQVEKGA